jgi:proliferating cell nuclear antigen
MIDAVAEEFRLRADSDGLHTYAIDPANVMFINVTQPADSFNSLSVAGDETTIGINSSLFGSALSDARYGKRTDDPVTLTADDATLETTIQRDYADVGATVTDRMELIDPDLIRGEPPDFDIDRVAIDVPPQALMDIIQSFGPSEYMEISVGEDTVSFKSETDTQARAVDLDLGGGVPDVEPTVFSMNYVEAIGKGLKSGYAESTTLVVGDDVPMSVNFKTETGAHGEYTLAPRIRD